VGGREQGVKDDEGRRAEALLPSIEERCLVG
jgi:hypothetical protein